MHLLVLGDDGFMGLQFVVEAAALGARVTIANHSNAHFDSQKVLDQLRVRKLYCDRDHLAACASTLRNGSHRRYDCLVDFSARLAPDVAFLRRTLGDLVGHYLLVSSEVVYVPFAVSNALVAQRPFSEDLVRPPQGRTLLQRAVLAADGYMSTKLAQEDALWHSHDSCATAVRLPFVIGPRDHTHRLAQLLLMAEANEIRWSPAAHVPISFVDTRTVSSALLHLIRAPSNATCGCVFNVAQPATSLADLVAASAAAVSTTAVFAPEPTLLPPTSAETVYNAVPFAPLLPFTLDTSRLRGLGWVPPVTLSHAAAEASHFVYRELLRSPHKFEKERRKLVDRFPDYMATSPNMDAVLRTHGLAASAPRVPVPLDPTVWLSFGLLMLAASISPQVVRIRSARHLQRVCLAMFWLPWIGLVLSGRLDTVALSFMSSLLRLRLVLEGQSRLLWPFGFNCVNVPGEILFGLFCLALPLVERCLCGQRAWETSAAARARKLDTPALSAFVVGSGGLFYYLFIHKMNEGTRFQGIGVGGPRSLWEKDVPGIIVSHESFQTWRRALVVVAVFTTLMLAAICYLRFAIARVLWHPRERSSMLALGLLVCQFIGTSSFETHHALVTYKMSSPTGHSGAITILWCFFGVLPALLLFFQLSQRDVLLAQDGRPSFRPLLTTNDPIEDMSHSRFDAVSGSGESQSEETLGLYVGTPWRERLWLAGAFLSPLAVYLALALVVWWNGLP